MLIFQQLILLFWIAFIVYWGVSAVGVKRNIKGGGWARSSGIRILIVVAIILLMEALFSGSDGQFFAYQLGYGVELAGTILCVAGIAFAIWARIHLGKNWSGTPSIKEGHELITSGPYRFVRHPIYTGMLVALIGSALVNGIDLIILLIFCVVFMLRIPVEERYMMQLFPDQYPEYKKRTKALIPFIW
jgi:isoprenylcysteine carboxyl methyltransferase (ICMT) family protein YpbQ